MSTFVYEPRPLCLKKCYLLLLLHALFVDANLPFLRQDAIFALSPNSFHAQASTFCFGHIFFLALLLIFILTVSFVVGRK